MELFQYCTNCKAELRIKSSAIARNELEDEMGGASFTKTCKLCHVPQKLHVNDVNARPSTRLILIIGLIAFALAVVLVTTFWNAGWVVYGSIALPYFLYVMFKREQIKSAHAFNNYRINRK